MICGSLEPGKDGVGDYVRVLGRELALSGNTVRLIAVHDRNLDKITETVDSAGSGFMRISRFPACLSWRERGQAISEILKDVEVDWASLHFVPFSFHDKGLSSGVGSWLRRSIRCRHWHIMFHETWVGFTKVATLKHRVWGAAQRWMVKRMVKRINPAMIHTSNPLYKIMLGRSGISAKLLQVPSNIPVTGIALDRMRGELEQLGIRPNERSQWVVIGAFGTVHPGYDYVPYFKTLLEKAKSRRQKVALLIMGRTGIEAQKLCEQFGGAFGAELPVHILGQRPEAEVSAFFQMVDYGLVTISRPFLGKSSVVAAMRLHGLEVLVPRELVLPDYDAELATYSDQTLSAPASHFEPATAARQLVADFASTA